MIRHAVKVTFGLLIVGLIAWYSSAACACGGLFSPESQLAQNAERIIFTDNGDGTISAIIQIQYTGYEEEFSWILPIPEAIPAEAIEVPETAQNAFQALELGTQPIYRNPKRPLCMAEFELPLRGSGSEGTGAGVDVFSSGTTGPYSFDIISSEDPTALVDWLREHGYQVTAEMEPLINVYVQEGMYFLAMQLAPEAGTQDIQPIKVTFHAERPMIPIRIAAVAAQPNTDILVWFFASAQAVPVNYAPIEIAPEELTFYSEDSHNYEFRLWVRTDEFGGKAFITEYAQPTRSDQFYDPLLVELSEQYPYLTRLRAVLSPEEMTLDPIFDYDPNKPDVSNIHDLQDVSGLYQCERDGTNRLMIVGLIGGVGVTAVALVSLVVGVWLVRRRQV